MKIQNLNNATTFISSDKDKIALDPWVVGSLYQNSWSSFPYYSDYVKYFENISHVIITHFHADHFDPETLKLIDRNSEVIIPELKFNSIMEKTLKNLNFKNVKFLKLSEWHKISDNFSIYIIPPLNEMAQEIELYEKYNDTNSIAIDTGIILNEKNSNTNHIFLADNSPYDLNAFKKHIGKIDYSSFWFPYNGFAGDYPLCYDNLSMKEKKKISLDMSLKREKFNLDAIEACDPKLLFPYSSDFTLHGPYEKEFFKVHEEVFFYKYKYAKRIEKITNKKSLALYGPDNIVFKNNGDFEINLLSKIEQKKLKTFNNNVLTFPEINKNNSLIDEIKLSLKAMFQRVQKYNLAMDGVDDWFFNIKTENNLFCVDLKNQTVKEIQKVDKKNFDKNVLLLKSTEQILRCLMQRKIHFDNAQIGCYLSWERHPNKFNKSLYDALCFFHI